MRAIQTADGAQSAPNPGRKLSRNRMRSGDSARSQATMAPTVIWEWTHQVIRNRWLMQSSIAKSCWIRGSRLSLLRVTISNLRRMTTLRAARLRWTASGSRTSSKRRPIHALRAPINTTASALGAATRSACVVDCRTIGKRTASRN